MRVDRVRKSVGAESTFEVDLDAFEAMHEALQPIIDKVWRHCETNGVRGRTVTLKMKYADFSIVSRSRSEPISIASRDRLEAASIDLLQTLTPVRRKVRLLGISVSSLEAWEPSPVKTLF